MVEMNDMRVGKITGYNVALGCAGKCVQWDGVNVPNHSTWV